MLVSPYFLQEKKIVKLVKIDNKLKRMDSDNQFVAEEVNGGSRTIAQTVCVSSVNELAKKLFVNTTLFFLF